MIFEEDFKKYLVRLNNLKEQLKDLTEEATKTALIMPFFSMLGYDVFDTTEFFPEFVCDFAVKKGEKIDYAVLKDGEPIMMIEVKRAGMKLQKQQQGQLYRYFSTNHCRIAILTNGVSYLFFSDLNSPNIMDDEPFLSFNLLEDDAAVYLSALEQFHKEKFSLKSVISKAVYQKYAKVVVKTLRQDLLSPSDEIVKYFLSRPEVKTGNRITTQMIEKYREVTRKAMLKVLGVTIEEPSTTFEGILETEDTADVSSLPQNVSPDFSISAHPLHRNGYQDTSVINDEKDKKVQELSVDDIAEEIIKVVIQVVINGKYQTEDTADCLKIHIYTMDNRKLGIVKIAKTDKSLQFRRIGDSTPYPLDTVAELSQYLIPSK